MVSIPLTQPINNIPFQYIPNDPNRVLTREQVKYIEDNILAPYVFKLNKTVMSGSIPSIDKGEIRRLMQEQLPSLIPPSITKEEVTTQCKAINNELKTAYNELRTQLGVITSMGINDRLRNLEDQHIILTNGKATDADIDRKINEFKASIKREFTAELEQNIRDLEARINTITGGNKAELQQNIEQLRTLVNTLPKNNIDNSQIQRLQTAYDTLTQRISVLPDMNGITQQIQGMQDRIQQFSRENIIDTVKPLIEKTVGDSVHNVYDDIDQLKLTNTQKIGQISNDNILLKQSNKKLEDRITATETEIRNIVAHITTIDTTIKKLDKDHADLLTFRENLNTHFDDSIQSIQKYMQDNIIKQQEALKEQFTNLLRENTDLSTKLEKQGEIEKKYTQLSTQFTAFQKTFKTLTDDFNTLSTIKDMEQLKRNFQQIISDLTKKYIQKDELIQNRTTMLDFINKLVQNINDLSFNLSNIQDIGDLKRHFTDEITKLGILHDAIQASK